MHNLTLRFSFIFLINNHFIYKLEGEGYIVSFEITEESNLDKFMRGYSIVFKCFIKIHPTPSTLSRESYHEYPKCMQVKELIPFWCMMKDRTSWRYLQYL